MLTPTGVTTHGEQGECDQPRSLGRLRGWGPLRAGVAPNRLLMPGNVAGGSACRAVAGLLGAVLLSLPMTAGAHSFARAYTPPMPYELYLYGAAATLVVSFFLVAIFATMAQGTAARAPITVAVPRYWRAVDVGLMALGLGLLGLCVASGLWGNADPFRNFNMTFFWVVFLLGGVYWAAIAGDYYRLINPWLLLTRWVGQVVPSYLAGRIKWPRWLGYWPATTLYMLLIGWELFGHVRPLQVSQVLLGYSALTLCGVGVFGVANWFRYADVLAVFFRLIGLMAPISREQVGDGRSVWRLRAPFVGLLEKRAEHLSEVIFILFLLSATAFDGLRDTRFWFRIFWEDPYNLFTPLFGDNPLRIYPQLREWYIHFEMFSLLLSPFLYLLVYLVFLQLGRWMEGSRRSLREWMLDYAYSLLPIVLVYHVTHYFTVLLSQGPKIFSLISDPLGHGSDLFGTALTMRAPILPEVNFVWHFQVVLIVLGHVVSVYLAHCVALQHSHSRLSAARGQLPMLALMVIFTTVGLWILAQPLVQR